MTYHTTDRWGVMEHDAPAVRFAELLDSLEESDDQEHPEVGLTHESGWTLSVFRRGRVVWENAETEEGPWHLSGLPRADLLGLWTALAAGDVAEIRARPWIAGYSPG
jgi:hypothetical protein